MQRFAAAIARVNATAIARLSDARASVDGGAAFSAIFDAAYESAQDVGAPGPAITCQAADLTGKRDGATVLVDRTGGPLDPIGPSAVAYRINGPVEPDGTGLVVVRLREV